MGFIQPGKRLRIQKSSRSRLTENKIETLAIRKIKRRKLEENKGNHINLEDLPNELLQHIFILSGNYDFPFVSISIYNVLRYSHRLGLRWLNHCITALPLLPFGRLEKDDDDFINERQNQALEREIRQTTPSLYCYALDSCVLTRRFLTAELLKEVKFDKIMNTLSIEQEYEIRQSFWDSRISAIQNLKGKKKKTFFFNENDKTSKAEIGTTSSKFNTEAIEKSLTETYIEKRAYDYISEVIERDNIKFPDRLTTAPFTKEKLDLIDCFSHYNIEWENIEVPLANAIQEMENDPSHTDIAIDEFYTLNIILGMNGSLNDMDDISFSINDPNPVMVAAFKQSRYDIAEYIYKFIDPNDLHEEFWGYIAQTSSIQQVHWLESHGLQPYEHVSLFM